MHEHGEIFLGMPADQTFPGKSLLPQANRINRLIVLTGARTVLDYGSGKGRQYEPQPVRDEAGSTWPSVIDYWGVDEIVCYDPCYEPFSTLPGGTFDGVISTDVLEHCPEEDLPWIIDEIFGYASKFVFANVACFPARKRLPNGENAHCTIKPAEWWRAVFEKAAAAHAELVWEVVIQSTVGTPLGGSIREDRIGNS
jgi:hypothetical protein